MRAWWVAEIIHALATFALPESGSKRLSNEEKQAVIAMLFIVFVEFIIFTALGNELFQQFGISDDLDIHVGINISLSIFLSFWPSHYIFVWVFPELSAQADANAEKRLKESSRSKT